jgi:hypothetical protein
MPLVGWQRIHYGTLIDSITPFRIPLKVDVCDARTCRITVQVMEYAEDHYRETSSERQCYNHVA